MNKNWSNTVLVAYSLLPKIVRELNFGVKTRVNSAFQSRHLKMGISNEELIGEILELTDEKRKIVNLRFVVQDALERLSTAEKNILVARIIEKKTFQAISEEFGISLRTVFRRVNAAEEAYASALYRAGFTEDWFEREYANDKYISPIHDRIMNDKYFVAKNL